MADQGATDEMQILEKDGQVIKSRLPDATSAWGVFDRCRMADMAASKDRAYIHKMYDGFPPYDAAKRRLNGQAHLSNLNFGGAAAAKEQALTAYIDMVNSVPTLARVCLKQDYQEAKSRVEIEQIINEEFTYFNKNWSAFEFNIQLLSEFFIKDGISIQFFDNETSPFWDVTYLQEFYVPRNTKATETDVDVAFCVRSVPVYKLYECIKDEVSAKAAGWDVAAVKNAIINFSSQHNAVAGRKILWEEIEQLIKNNDIYYSYAQSRNVRVVHCWVREYNGKYSKHIFLDDNETGNYLFSRLYQYETINEAMTFFPYGVGNGYFYSVRGQGFKILGQEQVANRLKNTAVDCAMASSSIMLQPKNPKSLDEFQMAYYGPFLLIPPADQVQVAPFTMPNLNQNTMPVINLMDRDAHNNTGTYQQNAAMDMNQARTATEVRADLSSQSTLSVGAMNLFYNPLKKTYKEQIRRIQMWDTEKFTKADLGYEEVAEFYRRLKARGVDRSAVKAIEDITPVRAIGYGSAAQRMLALDQVAGMLPLLDDTGRKVATRMALASRLGYSEADAIMPPSLQQRTSIDDQIAGLENNQLIEGLQVAVLPDQNHFIHLSHHIPLLAQFVQGAEQMDPQKLYTVLSTGVPHSTQHLQLLGQDKTREKDIKGFSQVIQQASGVLQRVTQMIQQAAQKHAQEAQQAQQPDPKTQKMQAETQANIQNQQLLTQNKLEINSAKAKQQMNLKDLKTSQELRHSEATHQQGIQNDAGTVE